MSIIPIKNSILRISMSCWIFFALWAFDTSTTLWRENVYEVLGEVSRLLQVKILQSRRTWRKKIPTEEDDCEEREKSYLLRHFQSFGSVRILWVLVQNPIQNRLWSTVKLLAYWRLYRQSHVLPDGRNLVEWFSKEWLVLTKDHGNQSAKNQNSSSHYDCRVLYSWTIIRCYFYTLLLFPFFMTNFFDLFYDREYGCSIHCLLHAFQTLDYIHW